MVKDELLNVPFHPQMPITVLVLELFIVFNLLMVDNQTLICLAFQQLLRKLAWINMQAISNNTAMSFFRRISARLPRLKMVEVEMGRRVSAARFSTSRWKDQQKLCNPGICRLLMIPLE